MPFRITLFLAAAVATIAVAGCAANDRIGRSSVDPATTAATTLHPTRDAGGPTAASPAAAAAIRVWADAHGWAVRRPLVGPGFTRRPVVYADLVRDGERKRAHFDLVRHGSRWRVDSTGFLGCGGC